MFVIAYGLIGEIAEKTRNFFANNYFEILNKIHYETERTKTISRYGKRNIVSESEIESSDFVYEVNGMKTGFNKQQILDAVHGKKDLFSTISSENLDFIKQIKKAYGDYVVILYAYIDENTLKGIVNNLSDITNEEAIQRVSTGKIIKNIYLENISLFDDIVIYAGENSQFNTDKLFQQYREIIKISKLKEKQLNSKRIVELPYVGNDDYLFVSYSHLDIKIVEPILLLLQRNGYRVWYDEGLTGGENWRKILKEKIKSCKNFMVFTSKNSVNSDDDKIEIITADNFDKKIINVQCDDFKFSGTYSQCINPLHAISYASDSIENELCNSVDFSIKE